MFDSIFGVFARGRSAAQRHLMFIFRSNIVHHALCFYDKPFLVIVIAESSLPCICSQNLNVLVLSRMVSYDSLEYILFDGLCNNNGKSLAANKLTMWLSLVLAV